jgi:uncharacterized protein YjiS (DUF1127 family)
MRELDLTEIDYHTLTQEQWEQLHREILLRAQTARGQALRHVVVGVLTAMRAGATATAAFSGRVTTLLSKWWHDYAARRERKIAARELHALDDRTLKDMGINRSEIEWVVHGQDATRLRDATIAAGRDRGPDPRANANLGRHQSTAHSERKIAA